MKMGRGEVLGFVVFVVGESGVVRGLSVVLVLFVGVGSISIKGRGPAFALYLSLSNIVWLGVGVSCFRRRSVVGSGMLVFRCPRWLFSGLRNWSPCLF